MEDNFIVINSDPQEIYKEAINLHKDISGEEVPLLSEVAYIYSTVAALLGIIKQEMNEVAVQNYLKYATGKRLDLKNIYGTRGERLGKNTAKTTMRCYISSIVDRDVIIPAGTRFLYKNYIFASSEQATIFSKSLYTDVQVECETAGDIGTILKGEIKEIVDRYDFYQKCENITDVSGGRDEEDDEAYRERLAELPESFTSAGSEGAYKFHTKKASSLVTDVIIKSPTENVLDIYVINKNKLLPEEEKTAILNYLEQEDIKALNDKITIKDPTLYNYNISIQYYLYKDARVSKEPLENRLKENLKQWAENKKIGESVNIQDIIALCKEESAIKRINVVEPAEQEIDDITLSVLGTIALELKGVEER